MALKEDVVRCSFCNKTQSQVRKLIAGPNGAYICERKNSNMRTKTTGLERLIS